MDYVKKMLARKEKLIKILDKKLNKKEQAYLTEIIKIEYTLTAMEEGHDPERIH